MLRLVRFSLSTCLTSDESRSSCCPAMASNKHCFWFSFSPKTSLDIHIITNSKFPSHFSAMIHHLVRHSLVHKLSHYERIFKRLLSTGVLKEPSCSDENIKTSTPRSPYIKPSKRTHEMRLPTSILERHGPYESLDYDNIEMIREREKERESQKQPRCLYKAIKALGVTTSGKEHTLTISCEKVVSLIKLGGLNKNWASQYCHFMIDLSKQSQEYKTHYETIAFEVFKYLLMNVKELTLSNLMSLISNLGSASAETCEKVCQEALRNSEILEQAYPAYSNLLDSCYRFSLYKYATDILNILEGKPIVNALIFDSLVLGLEDFSHEYTKADPPSRKLMTQKEEFLKSLYILIERCRQDRIQFITKHKQALISALESLDIQVKLDPHIKQFGHCINCNSILPTFDENIIKDIHSCIESTLKKRIDEKSHLFTNQTDLARFEQFVKKVRQVNRHPIDCVIDGLNVAYGNSSKIHKKLQIARDLSKGVTRFPEERLSQVLINTIIRSGLIQKFKKIVVIGKKHMNYWPQLSDFLEEHNIHYFFSDNHNKDDLYTLYAATLDARTILITNDFLRDHRHHMIRQERIKFERWIDTHQVWILRGSLKAIWATSYEKLPSVNHITGQFHIPIIDSNKLTNVGDQSTPPPHLNRDMLTWICCQPSTSQT